MYPFYIFQSTIKLKTFPTTNQTIHIQNPFTYIYKSLTSPSKTPIRLCPNKHTGDKSGRVPVPTPPVPLPGSRDPEIPGRGATVPCNGCVRPIIRDPDDAPADVCVHFAFSAAFSRSIMVFLCGCAVRWWLTFGSAWLFRVELDWGL